MFGGGTLETTASFTLNAYRGLRLIQVVARFNRSKHNVTYNGIMAGANAFTKAGTGTLSLGGVNTYSGATTISAGTLSLGVVGALGSSSGTTVSNNAALDIAFSSGTLGNTNTINLNGTGILQCRCINNDWK